MFVVPPVLRAIGGMGALAPHAERFSGAAILLNALNLPLVCRLTSPTHQEFQKGTQTIDIRERAGVDCLGFFSLGLLPWYLNAELFRRCRTLLISSLIPRRKTPLKTPESRAATGLQSF